VDLALGVFYKGSSLMSDCFQGVFDAKDNMLLYAYFAFDFSILKYNLIYNFGLIYEAFKSVAYFFYYPERNTVATPEDLGKQVGFFFYDIFSAAPGTDKPAGFPAFL
jgi:hypothetical protein